jgi:hypothetical protein
MRLVLIEPNLLRVFRGNKCIAEYAYNSPEDISPAIIEQLRTQYHAPINSKV